MPPLTGGPTILREDDIPRTGGPTQLSDGTQSRLAALLGGGLQAREQATGAAFEQFFTGQLSGNQIDLQNQLLKNRTARGIRGRAADAARDRLGEQFEASNRVAAAEFIGQALGQNQLATLGTGAVSAQDNAGRKFFGFEDVTGVGRASSLPSFQAFQTEIAGLRAEGLQFGSEAVNRRIESALGENQGDRRRAFESIFGTASLAGIQDAFNPKGRIERQTGQIENSLRQQLTRLGGVGGLITGDTTQFLGDNRTAELSDLQISGTGLEVNDRLLERLGLRSKQEAGGLHNVLAGLTSQDLAERARDRLGIDFGEAEDVRAEFVSGLRHRGNGTREAINFLAFSGGTVADSAELLLNLTTSSSARNRGLQDGARQNLQSLRELAELQENVGEGLGNINLLGKRTEDLAAAQKGPRTEREAVRKFNSITGNTRTTFTSRLQSEAANRQEQARIQSDISSIEGFRNELFSPAVPFFT